MLIDQQAHQLGDADGGMRVVELDCDLVRQQIEAAVMLAVAAQDVLQRRAGEEVLLLKAKFPAGVGRVVRVQDAAQVFR